ncbi:MFS transporter [Qipengyuania sp. GPGPB31]|uniref:MFS transporter n=1 Tax=Qipengyuania sp. GPGPB31 TaxID=3023518 RepID=UPI0031345EE4
MGRARLPHPVGPRLSRSHQRDRGDRHRQHFVEPHDAGHACPGGRSGEFFGLYAIAGTITVWMGPLLVEQFTLWTGDQRIGMTSIHLLFAIGFLVLLAVRMPTHAE